MRFNHWLQAALIALVTLGGASAVAGQITVTPGLKKPSGEDWDLIYGKLFGFNEKDYLPDIRICWKSRSAVRVTCAATCWDSTTCTADYGELNEGFSLQVYDEDRIKDDDLILDVDIPCGTDYTKAELETHRVTLNHQCTGSPEDLLKLGEELAQKTYERLFTGYFEIGRSTTEVPQATARNLWVGNTARGSYLKLEMADRSTIGYVDRSEFPSLSRKQLAQRSAFKYHDIFGQDEADERGWATNCHGVTFLAGAFWLNDANSIFERALEEIDQSQVQVGDFVLWKDHEGFISHSATVVATGRGAAEMKLYQDAGGLIAHVTTLQDHFDGKAYGAGDASRHLFARIRPTWPE